VTWITTYNHEGDGDSEPNYTTRVWRHPTEAEWRAIRAQRNPFDEPPPEEGQPSLESALGEAIAETMLETARECQDNAKLAWGKRTEL
jgi:hypothetical protein